MALMRVAILFILVSLSSSAGVGQAGDDPVQLKDVKIVDQPQGPTVTVETSGPPHYQATLLDSPTRLVIDVNGNYAVPRMRWTQAPAPIHEIRGSQFKPGTARLVLELTRTTTYRIQERPTGLSVVLETSQPAGPATAKPEAAKTPVLAAAASKPEGSKASVAKADSPTVESAKALPKRPDPAVADTTKQVAKREASAVSAASTPEARKPAGKPEAMKVAAAPRPATTGPEATAPAVAAAAPAAQEARPVVTAAAPPPPSLNGNKPITLDFKDADVLNVLRILGAEGGRNIVVGEDVKGKVTVSLHNITWDQALDTILEARALQKVDRGSVIRIVSNEQLAKEREALARALEGKRKIEIDDRIKTAEAQAKEHDAQMKGQEAQQKRLMAEAAAVEAESRGPLKEEILRLSYADPGEVAATLQNILGLGSQPIEPCIKVTEEATETKIEFRTGGGATSGPIAEPPFSQLFGPPRTPEQMPAPPPVSISQDVLARGLAIRAHCSTNSLFLRLYATDLDRVKKLIRESLDVPLPQVKIEARMEILDRTALEAIGIQWGGAGAANVGRTTVVGQGFQTPERAPGTGVSNLSPQNPNLNLGGLLPIFPDTGLPFSGNLVNLPIGALPNAAAQIPTAGLAFGIIGTNFNINLALQALSTLGKTRTLARPEIVTVENSKAKISLGEEIPYATVSSAGTQIQFKEALLKLEVIPMVIREKIGGLDRTLIKMFVVVENNSRGDVVNLGASGQPPAINKRMAKTQVLMNEGERLVIGGVTTGITQNTVRKVPLMGDIPVLGWLFKQKEEFEQGRELVVFLTPSVLRATVAAAPVR